MRHYGLPSRFLDCTESHAVAAWFASQSTSDHDFAIWAIHKEGLQRAFASNLAILGRSPSPLELSDRDLFSAVLDQPKRSVFLLDAQHKTQRQQAQKGLFLCPGNAEMEFWHNLTPEIRHTPDLLYRVVLPPKAREAIGRDLHGSHVHLVNLLPDIHHLEELRRTLTALLRKSQEAYGHFQWKLQVKPLATRHGLLDLKLD